MNTPRDNPKPPKRPALEIRTSPLCRRRYGRATLGIRPRGRLADHLELEEPLAEYQAGDLTAEELAWAFVKTRVVEHSPSFSWGTAKLERVLPLVVECSEEPKFEAADPATVARAIAAAHEKEAEQMRQIAQKLSRSFVNTPDLKDVLPPTYFVWAEQQQRTFTALEHMSGMKQVREAMDRFARASDVAAMGRLGKHVQQQTRLVGAGELAASLPVFDLGKTPLFELSRSLERTMDALGVRPMTLPPDALLNRQTVTFGEVLGAAEEAADAIEEQGAVASASELKMATAEVREVLVSPSTERLEEAVAYLTAIVEMDSKRRVDAEARLHKRVDDLDADLRTRDQRTLAITFILFILALLQDVFLASLGLPI